MEDMNMDEMRNQIAILKEKLEKQEIVNDRMIREIITAKTNPIKRKIITSIICGFCVIIMAPFAFHKACGMSWAFVIATDIMMLYCIIRELLFKRQVTDNKALMMANLLYVANNMKDFKAGYKRYFLSNLILIAVWYTWLIAEKFMNNSCGEAMYFFMGGLAVGGVVGMVIGMNMYFRIQNNANDIIRQIEE